MPAATTSRRAEVQSDNAVRSLPHRRTLVNGRAALGGLLVASAVVVLFTLGRAGAGDDLEHYVVARHALAIGTRLGASDLATSAMRLPAGHLRGRAFTQPRILVGSVVIAPVAEGELVQASAVVAADERDGLRQISVPVEAARALGAGLRSGELVDVVATFGTGTEAFTVTVVSGATVVGRDTSDGPLGDGKSAVVLLAVRTAEDGMAVAHAVAAGQISLVRVNGVAPAPSPAPYRRATADRGAVTDTFVVLGVAGARAPWFAAVGQWAHAGSLPVEFVKCVSIEQLRVRLMSGRVHSAVLLDGALPAVDRDLIDEVGRAGAATLVVDEPPRATQWPGLGVNAVLAATFTPADLLDALRAHAALVPAPRWEAEPAAAPREIQAGALVMVCGAGGTGVSVLTIALAQQLAAGGTSRTVLVDLCLRSEQGVLHDAGDVGPGVQELVDQCRNATLDREDVNALTYAVHERGYALLLGLRRASAWSTLRPRAVAAALDSLQGAFDVVVCDTDADLEGQADGGSIDVEERNVLTRSVAARCDVVFAVGEPGLKGVYSLARVVSELADAGIDPARMVPVVNRMPRSPRARARIAAGLAALLSERTRRELASPVFVPGRDIERALHDRSRLPAGLGDPLVGALAAVLTRGERGSRVTPTPLDAVRPGSLAAWPEEVTAP